MLYNLEKVIIYGNCKQALTFKCPKYFSSNFQNIYFTIAAEATRMTTVGQISVLAEIRNALKADKQHVLKVRETPSTSTSTRECQSEGRENGNTQRKTIG